jgi:hypothetical protein
MAGARARFSGVLVANFHFVSQTPSISMSVLDRVLAKVTHWDVLAAADVFTVDVWTGRGLTRFAVLFLNRAVDAPGRDRWHHDGPGTVAPVRVQRVH